MSSMAAPDFQPDAAGALPLTDIHAVGSPPDGPTVIGMGQGKVSIGHLLHEGRVGLVLHPTDQRIAIGQTGVLPHTYWPQHGDVVIWLDGPERGATLVHELSLLALPGDGPRHPVIARDDDVALQLAERMRRDYGADIRPERGAVYRWFADAINEVRQDAAREAPAVISVSQARDRAISTDDPGPCGWSGAAIYARED